MQKPIAHTDAPARIHYGWAVVFVGMLAVLAGIGLGRHSYTSLLPAMREGLGLTYTEAGLLATSNFIGYLFFSAIGGGLVARFGTRRVLAAGLMAVAAGMLATGAAPTFGWLLVARAFTGFASGLTFVPPVTLVSSWFAPKYRGLVTGIVVGGSGAGIFVSGTAVPVALRLTDWRGVWQWMAVGAAFIGVITWAFLRDRPAEMGLKPVGGDFSAANGSTRVPWRGLISLPLLWHLAIVYVTFGLSYIVYATFFTAHLVGSSGWTPAAAGQLWALVGGMCAITGMMWGYVSDRIGRRPALVIVCLLQALSYLLFGIQNSTAGNVLSAVLSGLTYGSVTIILASAFSDYLGPCYAPAAMGIATMIFGVGQAIAPSAAGQIADLTGSFQLAFQLAAVVSVAGAVISALLPAPGLRNLDPTPPLNPPV